MPVFAHSAVYAMAAQIYGPDEARRYMPRYYGFVEATNGSPDGAPDGEHWIVVLSRRVTALVAASVAILPRI
jgi:hypothetical protein